MNTGEEEKNDAQDDGAPALLSLDLEFSPAWARKTPESHHRRYADDPRGHGGEEPRHGGSDARAERGPRPRPDRDRRAPAPRDRRDGDRRDGGRPPRDGRPSRGPAPRSDTRRDFRPAQEAPLPPLPLEIRVLPDQKALGAIMRKMQTTHRAYPLRDIARLFLDNDAAYQIRIEPNKGETVPLFQCKVCGVPALSEEEIRTHLLATHLADFFDVSEIETEPPAGNFSCVARCGISGELLGPPNHHSYASRVQEMLRTRFAHMGSDAYRARIEMVRDPEAINQWRESCRKKIVYRRRPAPLAADPAAEGAPAAEATSETEQPLGPAMERANAELVFQREILPEQISAAKHLICPAAAVRRTPSARLLACVRETMNRELRFPASLFFALRGAFRHRSHHLFRANDDRGQEFVMARAPAALDAAHVVAELRQVLEHINQHPGCTRTELLAALAGGDEALQVHLATQLNTLVEKAHVIEYYNGVLCPPANHPVFHYIPGERDGRPQPAKGAPAKTPAATESAPAAEPAEPPAEEPTEPLVAEPAATEPATAEAAAEAAPAPAEDSPAQPE
jgi:hypothetical protein